MLDFCKTRRFRDSSLKKERKNRMNSPQRGRVPAQSPSLLCVPLPTLRGTRMEKTMEENIIFEYEECSIRCLCNSNSSCSVEKWGTHTIALPFPLRALHLRGGSEPKLKHKDSLKKALSVPFFSHHMQLVAHFLILSLAKKEEAAEMVDLGLLTDDQLKAKLLRYGVKAGPIVASTRALYEKKLKRLLDSSEQASQHMVNGTWDAGRYSDSEEEDERVEDEDKDSESEQLRSETVSWTETSKTASREKIQHKSSDATQNGSLSQSGSPYRSFSITQMVEEIENRFSPQSKQTEIERRSGQRSEQTVDSRALQDFMRLDKDTMTGRSLCLTSPSSHQKLTVTEPVTDVLSEMFPDTARTPTGIYATKRRPIKGAAGRPVQFKYPEMPLLSPTTLERQEIQQHLVPLWVQIMVFLLVVCLLYLIYSSMEEPLSNPFTALLEGLHEAALISTLQD